MKAVFVDYTGTIISEAGKDGEEFVYRVCKNSDIGDPQEFLDYWWKSIKEYEKSSYGSTYITEDQIVDEILERLVNDHNLKENLAELHALCQGFWVNAPFFEDVKPFFETCPYDIYVISNNSTKYIEEAMSINGLAPKGIVTADLVKAYKPHAELFEKALEISGCEPEEAVHLGDSIASDVEGANAAGIKAILIDRSGKYDGTDILTARSLPDALDLIG